MEWWKGSVCFSVYTKDRPDLHWYTVSCTFSYNIFKGAKLLTLKYLKRLSSRLGLVTSLRHTSPGAVLSRAVAEHVTKSRTGSNSLIWGVDSSWDIYTKTHLMRSLYVFISLSYVVLDLALVPKRWKHPWQRGFTCWRSPLHFISPHWAGLKGCWRLLRLSKADKKQTK